MAVFMEGKPVHSNASLLRQLQAWWADAVVRAEKVGIIGVRPNEPDTHIWDPLSATDAEIVVIGDRDAYQAWVEARRAGKVTRVVGDRFARDLQAFVDVFA